MMGTAGVVEVSDASFAEEVRGADRAGLVEFTAEWCPPCRQLAPVLAAVADEYRDRLKVVALDVDANPRTTAAYNVHSMPTLVAFRDGEPVKAVVGARSKSRLVKDFAEVL
jgi:thioredoxin 1